MLKKILTSIKNYFSDKNAWLAFTAGLCCTFAYAPFNFWPLIFIALAVVIHLTENVSAKKAAKYGFAFGFGWFALGISWVHVSIAQFGGLHLIVSVLLMAILCAYLALYPMLAFILANNFKSSPWQRVIALISGFAIFESLRGVVFTGFPWLSFGYALTDSPLAFLAPFIGEFGLSLLCVSIALALAYLYQRKYSYLAIANVVFVVAIFCINTVVNKPAYRSKVVNTLLVQGNIQQSLRWQPEQFWSTMSKYQDITRTQWQQSDLVVWPEAAIPELEDIALPFLDNLDKAAALNNTALITGIPDYQFATKNVFNTLIVLGKKQPSDKIGHYTYLHTNRYQKHQLLPIGEFVPFEDILRPLAPLFNLEMSSFTRGERVQKNLIANGYYILPAICYEIAFSELLRENYRPHSDILFTVSNDAWFGDSHGPHQHMQIARMRALELQRPLLRVTNNGISGVFDPISKQRTNLPQFETAAMMTSIKLIGGNTFYSQYGNSPIWLSIFIFFSWIIFKRVKTRLLKTAQRDFL